jgi:hypothetical protein
MKKTPVTEKQIKAFLNEPGANRKIRWVIGDRGLEVYFIEYATPPQEEDEYAPFSYTGILDPCRLP